MSYALSAGVTGLKAHQSMLDVAGNNLANISTIGFKSKNIIFSELLSETLKKASAPTTTIGGTNPQQLGSGVGIGSITTDMTQGSRMTTGNPLDVALEGAGYFVLNSGTENYYTRAASFGIDADGNLVDPSTGYIVQRFGAIGESDGFQTAGDSDIKIPYDVAMPASATTAMTMSGNLSASGTLADGAQANVLTSDTAYTFSTGTVAGSATLISALDQYTGTLSSSTITYSGNETDGTSFAASTTLPQVALTQSIDATTTMADILTKLNGTSSGTATSEVQTLTPDTNPTGGTYTLTVGGQTTGNIAHNAAASVVQTALNGLSTVGDDEIVVSGTLDAGAMTFTFDNTAGDVGLMSFAASALTGGTTQAGTTMVETTKGIAVAGILGSGATATLENGKIIIADDVTGYSKSDIGMAWSGDGTLTMPGYFENTTVGGTEVKTFSITVYDSQGGSHVLSGALTRTDTDNTWDMILASISGNVSALSYGNRRIENIEFNSNGSFNALSGTTPDTAQFIITFAHDTTNPQTVTLDLGNQGEFNGLTQFQASSTAVATKQDGYTSGDLSSVSVDKTGVIIGSFTNGIKKDLAALQVAIFKNPTGLNNESGGYFSPSINSGDPVITQGMVSGAGVIHGGSLEQSNADVAEQFIKMIEAQNGFQANARTIKIANELLRELTNLIR